mmetsp:Transcript_6037/g.9220  ORF Transcript_6037/g.9220 Transcript_6037/m.9220 type:complete len:402 (-) Transcript_6037:178-1383(-)|eukprot:CAMPEP_0178915658 /NCGR_PEP_ID=MMETSP0786-20121207/12154_1 /TAXON_ID=186022 /ORGANISM="Thalassionema frauenfeldii, Strain CCMP 1798" /LENGTH=401 /DNA_ID=CAMNT_0020588803 /DNA_START=129 /DNA_END=1334 /DNA_ORIENTATION=-
MGEDQGKSGKFQNPALMSDIVESQNNPAQNNPAPGEFVSSPRDMDVVSANRREFKNHPGTKFYRELVNKLVNVVLDKENNATARSVSEKIVEIITKDQRGVFLRQDEKSGRWYVMDHAASVHKAILAIKNAEIKARRVESSSKKKRKKGSMTSVIQSQDRPKINYQEGPPPPIHVYRYVYEVKEGQHPIDSYTKDIITLMCNETKPEEASRVLDEPRCELAESDEHRQIRLHLRQRYIAAMSMGMSPVIFSRKLLKIWGGTILSRKVVVEERARDCRFNMEVEKVTASANEMVKPMGVHKSATIDENDNSKASSGRTNDGFKFNSASNVNDNYIQSGPKRTNEHSAHNEESKCNKEGAGILIGEHASKDVGRFPPHARKSAKNENSERFATTKWNAAFCTK